MKFDRETLLAEASKTGFRPEILEKVYHLLALLDGFRSHPFLKERFALKGGTALNLFLFNVPRLSVDIDLNYVGGPDLDTLQRERPTFEQAVRDVCAREDITIARAAPDHAGGKWRLRYQSGLGAEANLELDLNFMLRVPLWPVIKKDSQPVGAVAARSVPLLDLHELAAGKLAALCARKASRDLFDAHALLTTTKFNEDSLRLGFLVYGGLNRKDWRTVAVDAIGYEPRELKNQLVPVLRDGQASSVGNIDQWAAKLVDETRQALSAVLPLRANETEFLDRLLDHGEIRADLLTGDAALAARIEANPGLAWKAHHARQHKGQ